MQPDNVVASLFNTPGSSASDKSGTPHEGCGNAEEEGEEELGIALDDAGLDGVGVGTATGARQLTS